MTTAAARTLELRFAWPPKEVFPNAKTKPVVDALGRKRRKAIHWSEKSRAVKQYRWDCNMDARDWHRPQIFTYPVKATVTFVVPDRRKRDTANMMDALKAMWDGIVDAKLLVDDSHEHLRHGEPSVRVEKGQRYVLVLLEEAR